MTYKTIIMKNILLIIFISFSISQDFDELYNNVKFSSGIELRAMGFLFYGYPAALTLEHHFPIADEEEKKSKTYLRLLFDF